MAITAHTLYAIQIQTTAAVDLLIDQISNQNVDTGITELLLSADGDVDNTFVALQSQNPRIGLTTSALATVLASCGISGLKIDSDVDDDGAECWFQKMDEGGVRATGANHYKLTVNEGLLLPRGISAPNDGHATMDMELIITYDGTNDPIVIASSQSLEGSPSVGEVFTCGKVVINGAQLEGIQNIDIDFGLSELVLSADGQLWPTFAAIQGRAPSITIRTTDVGSLSTFGLTGDAQGATDSLIYLRKFSEGSGRVADNVAEHISFSIDDGMIYVTAVDGDSDSPQMADVKITPTYDGSNAVMVINTATTIA